VTTLAPFELHRAGTVAEATALLDELGEEGVFYAGGTELLLVMKLGFASYAHLVDVKPVDELARLEVIDGSLHIGGAVSHRRIERSPEVAAGWPALARMERDVANIRVRNQGTLGGNLAFADPHSDPATFLLASDASVLLGRGDDRRSMPLSAFLLGPYATALEPGELLVRVEVPTVPDGAALAHLRFAVHERPAATVACLVRVSDGAIAEARIAVGSVGVVAARAEEAEGVLTGLDARDPDPQLLAEAGRAAAAAAEPVTDSNGSADYKAHIVGVLVGRAVRAAADAAVAGRSWVS
jgi:aerobic carbon-monoxide dehydrogenase medium subunit